jgi:hypothetical protein
MAAAPRGGSIGAPVSQNGEFAAPRRSGIESPVTERVVRIVESVDDHAQEGLLSLYQLHWRVR